MIKTYLKLAISLFVLCSCNEMKGNHSLGKNLFLWGGDSEKDRVIVYCTGDCNGGIYVIPTYKRHYDDKGHYAEYVDSAVSNEEWIIAKTFQMQINKKNYWIISKNFNLEKIDCMNTNCDSILQSHVIGPFNFAEFVNQMQKLKINLIFR